ncbi:DUF5361 domain-containing protein [Streptomyces rugosispiralis]|uniref:DUF5361 domain-containing protein n=1 Tax=Streptomyces rugosispiralis TaxID=2967341 RepID=A0ABT1USA8_9ACTN|nr:DUF5361 domain-containing protein [Streptomyces rugosispiralis]MCQ8187440.1 DUF5361 domain-containing protein [Streptomyces rugosispiralis]
MEEHAEALEADLLRYYGVDLLDWHREALSSRRLAVLVRHLPPDSAFVRAREGEAAEWGLTDHLLAAVVDHLAIANWMFASANRDEYADPPEAPVPVPRPGAEATDTSGGPPAGHAPTGAELARFFG